MVIIRIPGFIQNIKGKSEEINKLYPNAHQDVSKSFSVYSPQMQRTTKQDVKGTLRVDSLGKSNYYFIRGEWYEETANDELTEFSYRF